jgi:hypothetical protein
MESYAPLASATAVDEGRKDGNHLSRTNLFVRSDPRFRSGQTRERIPSNAWARKIAAPTKPITAVIVSNIANVPLRPSATENGGDLAQSKEISGTNTQSRSTEDSAQQTCIVLLYRAKNL